MRADLACIALVSLCGLTVLGGVPRTAEAQHFFMSAADASGQPVLDLSSKEVKVTQGESACNTKSLLAETNGMKIALLVENSAQSANSLNALRDGVRDFLKALPPQHEVALITIAGQVRMRVDFTTDRAALTEEAGRLFVERGSGGVLLDGLLETWKRRFDDKDAWPVFVVVAYDGPESSGGEKDRQFNQFVSDLAARGGTTHVVLNATQGEALPRTLSQNVTRNTGGEYSALAAATGMSKVLTDLAATMSSQYDQLKNRYRVVVECKSGTGQIGVEITRPGVGIRLFPDRRPAKP